MKVWIHFIYLLIAFKCLLAKKTAWELIELANTNLKENGVEFQELDIKITRPKSVKDIPNVQNAAIKHQGRLWPAGLIPYRFTSFLRRLPKASSTIKNAMREWEENTCIRFVERTNEVDYVEFATNSGCNADVGRRGGRQIISLGSGCLHKSVVVHEIGHVLGFWHEQNRPDRDNYVDILTDNIMDEYKSAFAKFSRYRIDSLKVPYDYHSIMHYTKRAFTKNGKPTILPKKKSVLTLGNDALSPLDIKQTWLLYKCDELTNQSNRTWTEWSEWTTCDKSCEGGVKERRRVCTKLKNGKPQCKGSKIEKKVCNMKKCPDWPKFPFDFSFEHLRAYRDIIPECILAYERADYQEWNAYSFCNRGERQIQMRWSDQGPIRGLKCTLIFEPKEKLENSWYDNYLCVPKSAPYEFTWSHKGPIKDLACLQWYAKEGRDGWNDNYLCAKGKKDTPNALLTPIDGNWASWSKWSQCTKECGGGTKRRLRACNNPKPDFGGRPCYGRHFEDKRCNSAACPTCGGVLGGSKGQFHSPKYPSNYPPNTNCTWLIQGNSKDNIRLNVLSFHFEKFFDEPCKFDYLLIREGHSKGKIIGTFCGNEIPKYIESKGSSLWINMITDRQDNRAGFRATWEVKKKVVIKCGGLSQGIRGRFSSPNFPRLYPSNTTCEWHLKAPKGYNIQMKFVRFDVVKHSEYSICKYDSVEIRDGGDERSPQLGRYCGSNPVRGLLKTTYNEAWIKFVSGPNTGRSGFKVVWRAYKRKITKPPRRTNLVDDRECPEGWKFFNLDIEGGACYKVKRNYFNWYGARDDCLSNQADLVSITTNNEQNFVTNDLLEGSYMWLGMTDNRHEGIWAWSDNTTTTSYNNWDEGDPNNGGRLKNEDCALIKPDGKWNDYPCKDSFNYICKRKPLETWNLKLKNKPRRLG